MSQDTKMPGGNPQASAKTVAECHAACVNDNTCVAVEWNDAGKSCSTHGTTAATQAETGTALYYLNRVCLGLFFDSVFGRPFVKRFALCYQTVV